MSILRKSKQGVKEALLALIYSSLVCTRDDICLKLGLSKEEWDRCVKELEGHKELFAHIESCIEHRTLYWPVETSLDRIQASLLYVLTRLIGPDCCIELGISNGMSSAFVLQALNDNGHGFLWSVDPNVGEKNLGAFVASELRSRWNPIRGRSQEVLHSLFERTGRIDMFIHDSEHAYESQFFEMLEASQFLSSSSVVFCDDIQASLAFRSFLRRTGMMGMALKGEQHRSLLGVAIKKPDPAQRIITC